MVNGVCFDKITVCILIIMVFYTTVGQFEAFMCTIFEMTPSVFFVTALLLLLLLLLMALVLLLCGCDMKAIYHTYCS